MKKTLLRVAAACFFLVLGSLAFSQNAAQESHLYVSPTMDLTIEVPANVRAGVVFQENEKPGVWSSRIQLQGDGADEIYIETYNNQLGLLSWVHKTFPDLKNARLTPVSIGKTNTPAYRYHYGASSQSYGMEMVFAQVENKAYYFQYAFASDLTLAEVYDAMLATLTWQDIEGAEVITTGEMPPVAIERVNTCGGQTHTNSCSTATNPFPCCTNGTSSCTGNCTWWAWEQACRNWGANIIATGMAKTWAASFRSANYHFSSTPKVGYIACRNASTSTPDGHVAYVTSVSGTTVYVTEQNCILGPCTGGGTWCCGTRTKSYAATWFTGGYWKKP